MVDEPLSLLAAFVAHYLDLGADAIHLYLDRPSPEAQAAFAGLPRVHLVTCDAAHWERLTPKGRPPAHPGRQFANLADHFARLEQDWFFAVDADEYLVMDQDPGLMLAALDPGIDQVQIGLAEQVRLPGPTPDSIFAGAFRCPDLREGPEARAIYGEALEQFLSRIVAGHGTGKSFTRRGIDHPPLIHGPGPRKDGTLPRRIEPQGPILAHFDALTPLHYLVKLLRKHLGNQEMRKARRKPGPRHPAREAQIALAEAACLDADPLAVIDLLHHLTPEALEGLQRHGYFRSLSLAPDAAARRRFPDLDLDYTPQGFDRALRLQHASTLARMGLTFPESTA